MDAAQIPHVKITWRIALELALAIVSLLALWSYLSARDAKVKAEATQAADEKVIAQNDQQIKQNDQQVKLLAAQIEQLKADQARQLLTLQATFSRAQTPAQSASLTDVLLALKSGETKVGGTATAPTLEVPRAELQTYEHACEECKIKFQSTAAQLANVTAQRDKSEQDKQLLMLDVKQRTDERDKWHTAAKGGSFWQRFTRSVKYLAIGAGAGAVAVCVSGHCR